MSIVLDGTSGLTSPAAVLTTTPLAVTSGGTGVTTSTGSGAGVHATAPTITGATITVAATAAPAFSAYGSVLQSLAAATYTKISYNTEEFDTNSNYDNATNFRFTPTVAGYYQVNVGVSIALGTGITAIGIYKNAAIFRQATFTINTVSTTAPSTAALIHLNGSTDYIEVYVYQGTGGALNCGSNSQNQSFSASMVRSA